MKIFKAIIFYCAAALSCAAGEGGGFFGDIIDYGAEYLSPEYLASPDGKSLLIGCKTGNKILRLENDKITGSLPLGGRVSGLCASGAGFGFATLSGEDGKLVKFKTSPKLETAAVWDAGHFPNAPVCTKDAKFVYFANQFTNIIRKIDASSGKELARGRAVHEPVAMALSPDEKSLVILNHLPEPKGGLYEENIACAVTILDADTLQTAAKIELPNGAINCKGLDISKDGKLAFVSYVLARFNVPTTQLERGWVNTNAVAVIDLQNKKRLASFLLDENTLGAANPWGVKISPDQKTLAVATAGTHEVHLINLPALSKKLRLPRDAKTPPVEDDLNFLSGIRERVALEGLGPRNIFWLGHNLYAAQYYSDNLEKIDSDMDNETEIVNIGGNPQMTDARKGDLFFNDARMCFQQWLSCATCHPATRSDNLNWDLVNDGICNPKQSKSMLYAHFTPPTMITGVRKDAETCVRAGLVYIQFVERSEEDAKCVDAIMKRLKPVPSTYAPKGKLSENAEYGAAIFESAGCAKCHSGKYFTDMKLHDMGTAVGPDAGKKFDTPALIEVWRSAPYLYDGRAKTIFDMLKNFNQNGRHGDTKNLSDADLRALEEYVLSL
ncbi:MAG: hypothetical protein J6P03_01290 [Opitutales bacterium]|nr:hypothetical protein [Opitutales bacterium]